MTSSKDVHIDTLSNGLIVLVEEMEHVTSVAYELLIPGGLILDEPERIGESLILAELTGRGAGDFDSRGLSDAFDSHGIRHGESAASDRFVYRGSALAEELPVALGLVADMVCRPHLPGDEIESIQSVLVQDIAAVVDNPARRAMTELSAQYYPAPHNRPAVGSEDGIKSVTAVSVGAAWKKFYHPRGAILSVAGNCRKADVLGQIQARFGAWTGQAITPPKLGQLPPPRRHHLSVDTAQVQIALAFPSAPFGHELYFPAKVTMQVLSGGMFGRLFTEVREKRGLCYSVYAGHSSTKEYGTVTAYAGTTAERAQETLTVMLQELAGVRGTVSNEELARAKANLKASLVLGQESSGARASSNAYDYWLDRRVRSIEEIVSKVDAVRSSEIDQVVERFPSSPFTLVTLGARTLE